MGQAETQGTPLYGCKTRNTRAAPAAAQYEYYLVVRL